ncbi:hypothetical protein DFQ27_001624, partial [Actinomortierella ambigua]
VMHKMLQYLESDRGKKQLDLLCSLSSFEVIIVKDNLQLATDISAGNGRAGRVLRTEDDAT